MRVIRRLDVFGLAHYTGGVRQRRLAVLALSWAGCGAGLPTYRSMHVVDGELVYSRPVSSQAYLAYLEARLALDREPADLGEAEAQIDLALQYDPRDPHLWTTKGEIAALAGDAPQAIAAAQRALSLRAGYEPAERLLARIQNGTTGPLAKTPHIGTP